MKFSTREDIEAPIDAVFDMLCDFEAFERSAMRRGAEVQRLDRMTEPGVGMTWSAVFEMRGKKRNVQITMETFDRPNEIVLSAKSIGIDGKMEFELIALSRGRTRIKVELEVKPLNLSSRLLVQSMKLTKSSLTKKYKLRVAEYAKLVEERHARTV